MRGADLLVQSLKAGGITRVFSLSGNQIMPVYDACLDHGIEIVHTRHEAAAVFMAEAHAQLTGQPGVALVTAGGGIINALGPLFTSRASETPVLLLSGDSPWSQDGRGAFQELDQLSMTAPVAKLSLRPRRACDLGSATAQALRVAMSGRPGPVHIALAFDVLEEKVEQYNAPEAMAFRRIPDRLGEEDTRLIAQSIQRASSPVVICGPVLNPTRAGDLSARLSEALQVPVIVMESPRGLKDPSQQGLDSVLRQADLVVSLGKRIDFTLAFGASGSFRADAGWIVVDAEADGRDLAFRNLEKRLHHCFAADPRDAACQLIEAAANHGQSASWRTEVASRLKACGQTVEDTSRSGGISSAQLCAAVQRQVEAANRSIIVCDGGEFGQWAQTIVGASRRVVNGVSGVIGGGLCYALAAKLAEPAATVFSLMGDGSAGFHFAEFETAARIGVPYVVVIGNDRRWNAEYQIQLRDYGSDRLIGCELSEARYDLAAAALGGHGEYVTDLADLDSALSRAVSSGKVACVNVVIDGAPAPDGSVH